ncbi:unnamed protein product [Trichobilharzia regenti]|nr:unnamed protein product [Trichobilharzia regenti]
MLYQSSWIDPGFDLSTFQRQMSVLRGQVSGNHCLCVYVCLIYLKVYR